MKGSQCLCTPFQCSLYLLLIQRTQRRCPSPSPTSPSFMLRSPLPLWPDHKVVQDVSFPFWLPQRFFLPSSPLLQHYRPCVSSLVYLCKLSGRCCWCTQLGMGRKGQPRPHSADIVHEASPRSRRPQTVSGLKHLPLSEAVNVWL